MPSKIFVKDREELNELIQGSRAPDFSRMIIDEIAVAIEKTSVHYVPGFFIYVTDMGTQIEITIDPQHFRDTIHKNIQRLEISERYEDCAFAMKVIKTLDEYESEDAVNDLLTDLNTELIKPKKRTRKKNS